MAKAAKAKAVEFSDRDAIKFKKDIFERHENIASAKGTYMSRAKREREAMVTIYEGMTAKGVPQKVSKLNIRIAIAEEKIKGWQAELDAEERKLAIKLARAQGDRSQLLLFGELPPAPKPPKAEREVKAKAEPKPPKPDLTEVEAAGTPH
jgi:hypothetical protein